MACDRNKRKRNHLLVSKDVHYPGKQRLGLGGFVWFGFTLSGLKLHLSWHRWNGKDHFWINPSKSAKNLTQARLRCGQVGSVQGFGMALNQCCVTRSAWIKIDPQTNQVLETFVPGG